MTLKNTVAVAQLVRVLVCGAEGRGFEPHQPPRVLKAVLKRAAFFVFRVFSAICSNLCGGEFKDQAEKLGGIE